MAWVDELPLDKRSSSNYSLILQVHVLCMMRSAWLSVLYFGETGINDRAYLTYDD